MEKHKFASISLTVRDRAISSKFAIHWVSEKCTLGNFQKNFPLPKNGSHFEFLPKMAKHKFAFISLTLRDSDFVEIFDPQGVRAMYSWQFSKNFPLPQNSGHFKFSNFCQKWQNTNLLLSP